MRVIAYLALFGSAAAAGPAVAGETYDPRSVVEHIFAMADQDRSGSLSPAEYAAARLERYGVAFEECDADADGETTVAEYLAVYDRHHPAGGRRDL